MAAELDALIAHFENLWPVEGAEEWDVPGMVVGSLKQRVSRVLLTVDVTNEILDEAIDGGFDLILAHHPYLLKPINSVSEEKAKGALVSKAIKAGVAIYAAHTNADIVAAGVSDVLAKSLGISNARPLLSVSAANIGHGRIGELESPISLGDFARQVSRVLPSTATGVRVAGDYEAEVRTIAVCGGAGDSFIAIAAEAGADVYLTADLRHHPAQDAREQSLLNNNRPFLIDVSHWASEWLWLDVAASQLKNFAGDIQFVVSQVRTDPWDFVITQ